MIEIMLQMQYYVPTEPSSITDEMTQQTISADLLHCTLFGGDQLTRKRAESAKELRKNSATPITQLKGLIPVCEDWHAKKTYLEV